MAIRFQYSSVYVSIPNFLTIPSPAIFCPGNRKSRSMFWYSKRQWKLVGKGDEGGSVDTAKFLVKDYLCLSQEFYPLVFFPGFSNPNTRASW